MLKNWIVYTSNYQFMSMNILILLHRSSLKHIHILSITFGVSSSFIYFSIAAFIALSMLFVEQGLNSFEDIFMQVFFVRNVHN